MTNETPKEMSATEIIDAAYHVEGFRLHVISPPGEKHTLWRILYKQQIIAHGSVPNSEIHGQLLAGDKP